MPFLPSPTVGQTRFSKTIAITKRYFFIFLRQDIFRFYSQNMDFCFFMFTTSHDGCQYLPMPGGNLRPIAQTGRRIFGRSGRSFLPVLPGSPFRFCAFAGGMCRSPARRADRSGGCSRPQTLSCPPARTHPLRAGRTPRSPQCRGQPDAACPPAAYSSSLWNMDAPPLRQSRAAWALAFPAGPQVISYSSRKKLIRPRSIPICSPSRKHALSEHAAARA